MKKYKNKIIVSVIIAALLIVAFIYGGNVPVTDESAYYEEETASSISYIATESVMEETVAIEAEVEKPTVNKTIENYEKPTEKEIAVEIEEPTEKETEQYYNEYEFLLNSMVEQDKYKTDPVPEGKPEPIEPENAVISDKELTCTLSVRCDTILHNIAWFDKEKVEIVPKDGVIFAEKTVAFYEGESVFNLLVREMKRNKIHLEFENTPIYNSAYIEGIANIYEFDCGELSGWMYKVNGWFPNYGCSRYQLKSGDKVEWVYTCDLGNDVDGNYSTRNGR